MADEAAESRFEKPFGWLGWVLIVIVALILSDVAMTAREGDIQQIEARQNGSSVRVKT